MKATERESSVLRPVNPLTSPSLGFGESDALTRTEPLRGGGRPPCVSHTPWWGGETSRPLAQQENTVTYPQARLRILQPQRSCTALGYMVDSRDVLVAPQKNRPPRERQTQSLCELTSRELKSHLQCQQRERQVDRDHQARCSARGTTKGCVLFERTLGSGQWNPGSGSWEH